MSAPQTVEDFLKPLAIDSEVVRQLSQEFAATFRHLSAESLDQFLPTPISESILRPVAGRARGRFLAIDIGGTNLRVGFVELLDQGDETKVNGFTTNGQTEHPRLNRLLEQSWPIQDHLKNENSEKLFSWVGQCVAKVVRQGCEAFHLPPDFPLPMGVTFSFPMDQRSLSEAKLMAMGKGFAITSDLDLGGHLLGGYDKHRTADMPAIKIAAIANDAVSTLVSFIYQSPANRGQKAAMGLIVGTGSNATIPLKLSSLHRSKRPNSINVLPGQENDDVRIAVNTEWSINGSAPPLRKFGLISRWDEELDAAGEAPGFQPLEYMTAGRYLGELARIIFLDYMTAHLDISPAVVPARLHQRFGLTTTFISHFYPGSVKGEILSQLKVEFPADNQDGGFKWTQALADALYATARGIEVRAAGITAAAVIGLLVCAEEIPFCSDGFALTKEAATELVVGYTGGCIQYFQTYLTDCQSLIDKVIDSDFGGNAPIKVLLSPCHDGGITGAGILVPAALASRKTGS